MSGFGQWYEEQQGNSGGSNTSSFSISSLLAFDENDTSSLPLFGSGTGGENGEGGGFGFSSMKASLESQLPAKVMGMNYQQRFRMFCACLCVSVLFFTLGFVIGVPLITVRPQKFALCFTFGSLMFMFSFAILKGPVEHLYGMLQPDRLVFTSIYVISMATTLYFTFNVGGISGYVTVLCSSAFQILSLMWYLITFLPGGAQGMNMLMKGIAKILRPLIVGCAKAWGVVLSRCLSCLTQ